MVPLPQCRNLKELLKEEQEPFQSHNPKQNVPFRSGLPRNACFCTSSSSSSPDTFRKSPLFLPAANKKNTSDALFLHVPPNTASLLLEAALRVLNNFDSKPRFRHSGFGLLNSVVKRLRIRTRTQIQKTGDEDLVRWAKSSETPSNTSGSSPSSSYFLDNANELEEEGKQVEDIRFVSGDNNGGIGDEDFPSPSRTSPAFSMSPSCPTLQENMNYEKKLDKNQAVKSLVEEDEEEKEQKSPVSILDSPFEDEDCHGEEDEEFHREDGRSDLECSFSFIQRAKRRALLNKLQKFDELAHLYPIKLDDIMEDEEEEGDECARNEFKMNIDVSLPWMKRLVYDIIREEQKTLMKSSKELNYNELIRYRVWKRLESWREVEDNTIDMMIGIDFRREGGEWKKQAEDDDISWTVREIESSIFAGLVQEFVRELV